MPSQLGLIFHYHFSGQIEFLDSPPIGRVYQGAPPNLFVSSVRACFRQNRGCSPSVSVTYQLVGVDAGFFKITDIGQITVAVSPTRPLGVAYGLTVIASGGGRTASHLMTMIVSQQNLHQPVFTPSEITLYLGRNTATGTQVARLQATDADTVDYNRNVTYYIYSALGTVPFTIHSQMGTLQLAAALATSPSQFSFNVYGYNDASPRLTGEATVNVVVLNNAGNNFSSFGMVLNCILDFGSAMHDLKNVRVDEIRGIKDAILF